MNKAGILLVLVFLLIIMDVCSAEPTGDVRQSDTLTGGFCGLNDQLADDGIEIGFGITNIYQANVKGGLSTHNKRGRYSGSYDLELTADTQKLFGIEGGSLYVHGEGWWSKSGGIDRASIGSAFGVNGDAGSRDTLVITEFWWEQTMLDDTLRLRLGKLDMTGGFEHHGCPVSFDCSSYANDETSQFLNNALINNPTIPFPDYGLGAVLYWNPIKWWYASVGIADAQADARETGFRTTFGGEDYFLYIFETGVSPRLDSANGPLQGTYRIGLWNDPQPKANSDGTKNYRDDVGFYICCDQALTKENAAPEDSQGLGAFFRYGYAPSKRNDITNFFSFGFQYQGLIDGRDDDVLGVGFAQGIFSNSADTTYTDDYENALELYYNAQVAGWLNISPSIQYVTNTGGNKAVSDAIVLGVRVQMTF
jgi:porin